MAFSPFVYWYVFWKEVYKKFDVDLDAFCPLMKIRYTNNIINFPQSRIVRRGTNK